MVKKGKLGKGMILSKQNLDDVTSNNDSIVENDDGDNKVSMWTTWMGMLQIEDNNTVQDKGAKNISDAANWRIRMMDQTNIKWKVTFFTITTF